MEETGFRDVQERFLKSSTNDWPRDPRMKEIGRFSCLNYLQGLEVLIGAFHESPRLVCRRGPNIPCPSQKGDHQQVNARIPKRHRGMGQETISEQEMRTIAELGR